MRCLQCGSTLSAFKKLTDSDFCSAEHRDSFYGEQQRLILDRLKQSATRFHRLRRITLDAGSNLAAQVIATPEAQAPAKIAAFLYAKLEAQQRPSPLRFFLALFEAEGKPLTPQRNAAKISPVLFGPPIPDLPWPRYNAGLRSFEGLMQTELAQTASYGPSWNPERIVRTAIELSELFPSVGPDAVDVLFERAISLRMAKPKPHIVVSLSRAARLCSTVDVLTLAGYRNFVELTPIHPPRREARVETNPIEVTTALGIPASLRLRPGAAAQSIAFLDRIYRMRARSGVQSPSVPAMQSVALDLVFSPLEPIRPCRTAASPSAAYPGKNERFIRVRPTGPKTAPTPAQIPVDPAAISLAGQTSLPELLTESNEFAPSVSSRPARLPIRSIPSANPNAQPGEIPLLSQVDFKGDAALPALGTSVSPAPTPVERFFRARPRGPVETVFSTAHSAAPEQHGFEPRPEDPQLPVCAGELSPKLSEELMARGVTPASAGSGLAATATSSQSVASVTIAVKPALATRLLSSCEPAHQTRFFRGRPRGPVSGTVRDFENLHNSAEALLSPPFICNLRLHSAEFTPVLSDRIFRMRPRSGVLSAEIAALLPSAVEEPLLSAPATPAIAGITDFAPLLVTRMFRMRPKSGVDASTIATPAPIIEILQSGQGVAKPALPGPALSAQVAFLDKLYRGRPKAAVNSENAPAFADQHAMTVAGPMRPAVLGMRAATAGHFAPRLVDRLYRGRPRLGVSSEDTASYLRLEPDHTSLQSAPAVRGLRLDQCQPALSSRLYRFRPKAGVDAATAGAHGCVSELSFEPQAPAFVPDWYDVISGAKPIFLNRMYRMRLKHPAQDAETLSQPIRTKHLPVADPEPVIAALPAPRVEAAPSFLDRLYRMRPKSGKVTPPAASPIPCDALEPRTSAGAPHAVMSSISKQWKATPMSIKAIAATLPLLLFLLLAPFEIPSQAATDPLRRAIVRRAAVDHQENFVGDLVHWSGVANWKRLPGGGVQPVGLGLFTPSLEMRNYVVEFSAQILKGGVGFVARAADEKNYQAVRLVTLKPGPLPTVAILRYAVIDGKETNRQQTILPITVAADTVYRVSLDINDQSFTLMVQGKVVDFWSEERLKTGGAGFYGAKGERASVQNVRMFHQNDAIGKLFAALALHDVQQVMGVK
jgi:hypothetical protein